jgi:hypothetical protein
MDLVHPAACENALRDSHKRLLYIQISITKRNLNLLTKFVTQ